MVISEKGTLSWSADRSKIFVGLKEQEARPQPRAIRRRSSSRSATSTSGTGRIRTSSRCRWCARSRIAIARSPPRCCSREKKVVPLADARMDRVQVTKDGNWAIGQDDKEYVRRLEAAAHRHLSREHDHRRAHADAEGPGALAGSVAGRQVLPVLEGQARLVVRHRSEQAREHHEAGAGELRERRRRSLRREAGVRHHRLHEGRQVGHSRPPLRSVGRVARRQRQRRAISRTARARRRETRFRYVRLEPTRTRRRAGGGRIRRTRRWRRRQHDRSLEADHALGVRRLRQEVRLLPARRRQAHEARRTRIAASAGRSRRRTPIACCSRARRSSSSPTTG